MSDHLASLLDLLEQCGARMTFDSERSTARPCHQCGRTDTPRDLVDVGTYITNTVGGLRHGDPITRPMCSACRVLLAIGVGDRS